MNKREYCSTILALAALVVHSTASSVVPAKEVQAALARNDFEAAKAIFEKDSAPVSSYNIGYLAENGKLPSCDPIYCASKWYFKAANMGHIPSMTRLGALNYDHGYPELGVKMLTDAAALGDQDAVRILNGIEQDRAQKKADLFRQQQEIAEREALQQQQALIDQQRAILEQQAQAQLGYSLGYMIGCGFGSGCAGPSQQTRQQEHKPMICRSMGSIGRNDPNYRCQ